MLLSSSKTAPDLPVPVSPRLVPQGRAFLQGRRSRHGSSSGACRAQRSQLRALRPARLKGRQGREMRDEPNAPQGREGLQSMRRHSLRAGAAKPLLFEEAKPIRSGSSESSLRQPRNRAAAARTDSSAAAQLKPGFNPPGPAHLWDICLFRAEPHLCCLVEGRCGSSCQGPPEAAAHVRDREAVSGPHVARVWDLGGLCLQHAVGGRTKRRLSTAESHAGDAKAVRGS